MTRPKAMIAVFALSTTAVMGSYASVGAQEQNIGSHVTSLNNSLIDGTLRLMETSSGKTRVEVHVSGAGSGPEPIHVHDGTCADMNPEPKIPLTTVLSGVSITDLDVPLAQLVATPHAIYLHKSPEELPVFVACADIMRPVQTATIPSTGEPDLLVAAAPGLVGLGAGLAAAGLVVRRIARPGRG